MGLAALVAVIVIIVTFVWTKSFNVKVLNDGGEVGLIGVDAFVSGSVNRRFLSNVE